MSSPIIHKIGDTVCPRDIDNRREPFMNGVIVRKSDARFDWIVKWPKGFETAARDCRLILSELVAESVPIPVEQIPLAEWDLPSEWTERMDG